MAYINENIIKYAVRDSINDLLINEGGGWESFIGHPATKTALNGLNKIYNGIKSFAYRNTNNRQNGNSNYNYYPKIKTYIYSVENENLFVTSQYQVSKVFKSWMQYHANNIYKILSLRDEPENSTYEPVSNVNSKRNYKYKGENGAKEYIKNYITIKNFYNYINQFIKQYPGDEDIENYIVYLNNCNPTNIINQMKLSTFLRKYKKSFYNYERHKNKYNGNNNMNNTNQTVNDQNGQTNSTSSDTYISNVPKNYNEPKMNTDDIEDAKVVD